eukprot:TRINITY_DN8841_c0_g1_i1.p1 TRINITY_DN8841_c0_g1~~TRINITY_DN8841_c0_g1_i1.p1  ORF type:complete len:148 (-),score=7.80 TRINITY_DN8841_c0_g1_i1:1030-1473(-)
MCIRDRRICNRDALGRVRCLNCELKNQSNTADEEKRVRHCLDSRCILDSLRNPRTDKALKKSESVRKKPAVKNERSMSQESISKEVSNLLESKDEAKNVAECRPTLSGLATTYDSPDLDEENEKPKKVYRNETKRAAVRRSKVLSRK